MRSNVKLSCDEAEKPAVIIHARCVPMPCRRSANLDTVEIPAAEGEGAVVGAADVGVLGQGAMVFHHCGELPSGFGDPGGCAGAGGPDVVGGPLALPGRPALPGLAGSCGEGMFGEMRGLEGPRDSGVTQTTVGGVGKIPGILGIFSMLYWYIRYTRYIQYTCLSLRGDSLIDVECQYLPLAQPGFKLRRLPGLTRFQPGNPADPAEHLGSQVVGTLPGYGFRLRLSPYRQSSTNLMN